MLMRAEYVTRLMAADPREERLPKWAQDKLRDLRRHAGEQEEVARRAVFGTDPAKSTALLNPLAGHGGIGLGENCVVRFRQGVKPGQSPAWVDVEVRFGAVWVRADRALSVEPVAANSLRVRSLPWDGLG